MRSGLQELTGLEDLERLQGRRIRLPPTGEHPCKRGQNVSARLNSLPDCRACVEAPLCPIHLADTVEGLDPEQLDIITMRCGALGAAKVASGDYSMRLIITRNMS